MDKKKSAFSKIIYTQTSSYQNYKIQSLSFFNFGIYFEKQTNTKIKIRIFQ